MYATWEDVEEAYERTIPEEQRDYVTAIIERAERRLVGKVRSIPRRLLAGDLDKQDVVDLVVTATLRIIRNPEGASLEVEGNYTIQVRADVAGGALFYTDDELLQVRPLRTGTPGTIWSRVPAYRRTP